MELVRAGVPIDAAVNTAQSNAKRGLPKYR